MSPRHVSDGRGGRLHFCGTPHSWGPMTAVPPWDSLQEETVPYTADQARHAMENVRIVDSVATWGPIGARKSVVMSVNHATSLILSFVVERHLHRLVRDICVESYRHSLPNSTDPTESNNTDFRLRGAGFEYVHKMALFDLSNKTRQLAETDYDLVIAVARNRRGAAGKVIVEKRNEPPASLGIQCRP